MSTTKKAIIGAIFSVLIVGVARITIGYHERYLEWILLPGYEINWLGRGRNWTVSSDHIIIAVSVLAWFAVTFATLAAGRRFFLNWILRTGFLCIYVGAVIHTGLWIPSLFHAAKAYGIGSPVVLRAIGALSIILIAGTLLGMAILSTIKEEVRASNRRSVLPPE